MQERHDLIVVGCGPAGASCAGRAADLGLSVVAIERARFPRSKPCGAGLTQAALRLLGGGTELPVHDTVRRLRIETGRMTLVWTGDEPLVWTTTRRELDALLARRAMLSGARIEFGVRVDRVTTDPAGVVVEAGGRRFLGRFLVGADGPIGSVSRALGYGSQRLCGAAYVRAFPQSASGLEGHTGVATFDPTATRRGYGWIFPKRDHLNVGVFSQKPFGKWILGDLRSYVGSLGMESWRLEGPLAAPIPSSLRLRELSRGRVLLAGDAAGLADPISGEGISHAVASGVMAAEAVADAIRGQTDASLTYSSRVASELVPTLGSMRVLGNFLYSLGPRGIERAAAVPLARFAIRRLGWWKRSTQVGGTLVVEPTQGRCHQQ